MALGIDACIAQHQGDRKEQQDRVLIVQHPVRRTIVLAAVADGMGGHAGGALAAEQVVHTARASLGQFAPDEEDAVELLRTSMLEAHTMIKVSRFINEKDPHSTAVMLLLKPDEAIWGYCGDSRLYRFRNGKPVFHTVDHSYVEHLLREGKISREEAESHPNRNILMTSLGGRDTPVMDFGRATDLQDGDHFLLCSDGLWGYFSDQELATMVAAQPARQAAEALIAAARERAHGTGDNVSVAIIKLHELPKPKPALRR
jgi:PPM family protein phosphatase